MDVKTSDYEPVEKQLAKFIRALAHPARMAIMIRLARQEGCTEGIINDLPIEESSVAKHLKALEVVGLIKREYLKFEVTLLHQLVRLFGFFLTI